MNRAPLGAILVAGAIAAHATTSATNWSYYPLSNEVTDLKVFRPTNAPVIWIGTHHGVVRIKGNDTLWLHPTNSRLPGEWISGLNLADMYGISTATAMDSAGSYWIGYSLLNKLVRIDTLGNVTVVDSSASTPWNSISAVTASKTKVYVGNRNGLVFEADPQAADAWTKNNAHAVPNPAGIYLTALAIGSNDMLWEGTSGNKNGNLSYYDPSANTVGVVASAVRSVWGIFPTFFTSSTLSQVLLMSDSVRSSDRNVVVAYNAAKQQLDTLATGTGSAVTVHGNNYVTVGDSIILQVYQAGISARAGAWLGATGLNCVAQLDTGILFGTSSGLAFSRDPQAPREAITFGQLLPGHIVGAVANGDSLWIATDSALYLKVGKEAFGDYYKPLTQSGLPSNRILSISRDSSGSMWVGQSNGLYHSIAPKSFRAQNGIDDSVFQMAHSKSYDCFWERTANGGATLILRDIKAASMSIVPMTGIKSVLGDSMNIAKIRMRDDGSIWVMVRKPGQCGKVFRRNASGWSTWNGLEIEGSTSVPFDFDLSDSLEWAVAKADTRATTYYAGLASQKDKSTITAKFYESSYAGDESAIRIFAESDTSAWLLTSADNPDDFTSMAEDPKGAATTFRRLVQVPGKSTAFADGQPTFSSLGGTIHQGPAAPGDAILPDGKGGFWIVMTDGVARMSVDPISAVSPRGVRANASVAASILDGRLALDLPAAGDVHIDVLDLGGRTLGRIELGSLTAGRHVVALPGERGMRILRVQACGARRTLVLPSL